MVTRKNPWVDFVKQYQLEHPGKSWGECMAAAKPLWNMEKQKGVNKNE